LKNKEKTKEQLITELEKLQLQIDELEASMNRPEQNGSLFHIKDSYRRLIHVITAVTSNEKIDIKDAFEFILNEISHYIGWPIGHVYTLAKDDPNLLEPTGYWDLENAKQFAEFCKVTAVTKFSRGIGLPGRVLSSGKPCFIKDVTKDRGFLRAEVAKDLGIKSGFAFPVFVGTKILAVLEHFTTDEVEFDNQFMKILIDLGTQIGWIFERKQIKSIVKEVEERYRAVFEQATDSIVIVDGDTGEIVEFNNHAHENLGYTREEFEKLKISDIDAIESSDDVIKHTEEIMREGINIFETRHKTKDGKIRDVQVIAKVLSISGKNLISSVWRDITDRKRAEEELNKLNQSLERSVVERTAELTKTSEKLKLEVAERKLAEKLIETSRDYLQKLNDSLGAVIFTVRIPERVIEYVNCTVESVFGYKPDECIGKKTKILYPAVEEYHGFGRSMETAIKEGRNELREEGLFKRKNGEIFPCEVTTTFIMENEKIVRVISILHDITERKKMEEELAKIQRLESLGILAGGIAHDFNNSLQGILSIITLARTYASPQDEIYGKLQEAEKAVLQSSNLPKQLLTFSKGGDPVRQTVSLSKLLKNSTILTLSGSNVKCDLGIPVGLWPVEVDSGQINQVMNNIIINSIQSMPEGGKIKVWAENVNVSVNDSLPLQEGRYVKITIKDQGTGIPQEHLEKIFDPYFTSKEKGSGLGLSISYSIINKHDGHIAVDSETGVGTTFYVYLPASQKYVSVEPEQRDAREVVAKEVSLMGKGKILIMDDEAIISLAVAHNLKKLKYEVKTASNGAEAIELYKRAMESGEPFDAVIMDLTIPGGMGGEEAIKKLLEIDSEVRAIVASGYCNHPVMSDFEEYGFSEVIEKPYEISELVEKLNRVMSGYK
jgi:PAS domain S-box-containing protein